MPFCAAKAIGQSSAFEVSKEMQEESSASVPEGARHAARFSEEETGVNPF